MTLAKTLANTFEALASVECCAYFDGRHSQWCNVHMILPSTAGSSYSCRIRHGRCYSRGHTPCCFFVLLRITFLCNICNLEGSQQLRSTTGSSSTSTAGTQNAARQLRCTIGSSSTSTAGSRHEAKHFETQRLH